MKEERKKIAIIQPLVTHYRQEFYKRLQTEYDVDVYSWYDTRDAKENGLCSAGIKCHKLKGISLGPVIIYNFLPFLFEQYDVIVLLQEMKYLSHWFIVLFARLFGKKVVLWGHGITASKYISQEKKMPLSRNIIYRLSDGAWFYTKNEQAIWKKLLPNLKSAALGNTISGVSEILASDLSPHKNELKEKYNIKTEINFIICTRFKDLPRRMDLFVKLIEKLDARKYGFIVIGDGKQKPDFSSYPNVYDFGAVYDKSTKDELFTIADIYHQPAWTGLSIVEAMAYGKPVFTFKRSEEVLQCVEYGYIKHGYNGMIFDDIESMIKYIENIKIKDIAQLGTQARQYVQENLTMENMVDNAVAGIGQVL